MPGHDRRGSLIDMRRCRSSRIHELVRRCQRIRATRRIFAAGPPTLDLLVSIVSSAVLQDLSGLEALEQVAGELKVEGNRSLATDLFRVRVRKESSFRGVA
jgi:hypothetical protein